MEKNERKMHLPSIDNLFTTQEERENEMIVIKLILMFLLGFCGGFLGGYIMSKLYKDKEE